MDRELLLEIGCEELPASWLPGADAIRSARSSSRSCSEHRLPPEAPAETFSTPRRLTVRIARLAERQTDLEELVNGPPVSAGVQARRHADAGGGRLRGEAGRRGRRRSSASRRRRASTSRSASGSAARRRSTCCRTCSAARCAALTFPKLMHWDAMLEDGRGELLFGRPIRWILFLYGGRVVPFTIARTSAAQTGQVQDVTSGAVTYGHRFLTTSGRAGPRDQGAIVRRVPRAAARELRHPRAQRAPQQDRARARRQGAAAAGPRQPRRPQRVGAAARSAGSRRVSVGRRRHLRARVPRAARRSADDDADSSSALLSGRRRGRQAEERVSRGHQHRAGQRADDRAQRRARRHGAAARRAVLLGSRSQDARSSRGIDRLGTLLFHKKLGQLQGEGRAHRAARAMDRARGASAPTTTTARAGRRRRRGWRRPI